jgi:hypothetical protein
MADKKQNYELKMTPTLRKYKAGFGPLQKRPKLGEARRKNLRRAAENRLRERAKDHIKERDALEAFELKRRVKFAKEHPLMPRGTPPTTRPKRTKKRPIKKMGGPSRKPAPKFDIDVRSPFVDQALLRRVSGR